MEPRAVAKSSTSVEVTWSGSPFDGGCQILRYLVDMAEVDGGPRTWTRVSSELSTSCVVTGLTPGISYTFVVRAENVRGIGDPTAESNVVTLPVDDCDDMEDSDSEEPVAPAEAPVSVQQGSKFQDLYDLHEEVGKGRFGTVYRCIRKSDNSEAAAKVVSCIRIVQRDKVLDEIAVMNLLRGHPKLLNLQAAFERTSEKPRQMVLVTEFVSGGELFERVIADDFVLTERDCVLFVRQICSGVAYMHQKRVVHLDLKPENILCQGKNSHKIKLIDFGLAQKYDPEGDLKVLFGTPEFVAPEVVNYERISPATDMWSVGVICYVLLSGLSPFMGDTDAETYSNIIKVDYDFDDEVFEKISDTAKDFIQKLLIKNPQKRLSAQHCLEHEWLKKVPRRTSFSLPKEKLKKFVIRRKWLKTGNAIMALGRMVNLTSISSSPTKQDDPQLLERPAPNGS
ncbi:myosin light chain kinase, smooth muscle-like [Ornithodoros turicata]|uniref:myosin light chain kinase, smooth muscle-like n=1 Tax=Ornithodoros turicata TaxID=34597 RepID=UPI0031392D15